MVEAQWSAPNGDRWAWLFGSSKPIDGPATDANTERFEGFIADAEILERIRRRRLEGVPLTRRLRRLADNASLLVARSVPWPEVHRRERWRRQLQRGFANWLFPVLGLAALGLFSLRRHPAAALAIRAHLGTILFVGTFYLGEARYRVPYDPLLLVLATVGLWRIGGVVAARPRRSGASPA
jgi:hypothetical protein